MKNPSFRKIRLLVVFLAIFICHIGTTLICQTPNYQHHPGKIKIASCQFPVSDNIEGNARWITDHMISASGAGAQVAHFPECALSGYPGVDLKSMDGFNWQALHKYTDTIMDLAKNLKLWVLLGSIHPLGEGFKPMNSLYVINPSGEITDRYDKQFCTGGDLKFFSAGSHYVTFDINEVKCGLLICFDVRFPELYRDYKELGVDMIFQSFHNARQKPGGIHPVIMPLTSQARAATNYFYMSLTNSSAPNSWPCHFITPDGLIKSKLDANIPGVLISEVDLSERYYDASKGYRNRALEGKHSSEDSPEHPRYLNRKSF